MLAARRSNLNTTGKQGLRSEETVRNRESGVLIGLPRGEFDDSGCRCAGLLECAHSELVCFGCFRVLWSFHGYCRHEYAPIWSVGVCTG